MQSLPDLVTWVSQQESVQTPPTPLQERDHALQVLKQPLAFFGLSFGPFFGGPAGFQHHPRLGDHQGSALGAALPPGRIQRSDVSRREPQTRNVTSQLFGLFPIGARQRHQEFSSGIALELSGSDLCLQPFRQFPQQSQATADPARGSQQSARNLPLAQTMLGLQRLHQVGVFQARPLPRLLQQVHLHQSIHFVYLPYRSFQLVHPHLPSRPYPLESINQDIPLRRLLRRHYNHRCGLALLRQTTHQPFLLPHLPDLQTLVLQVQMMQFDFHVASAPTYLTAEASDGLSAFAKSHRLLCRKAL